MESLLTSVWLDNNEIATGSIDGSTRIWYVDGMDFDRIRSSSLETKFNMKSDHMGIVSITYNSPKHLLATNSINGDICLLSTETGFFFYYHYHIGQVIKTMAVGPMQAWPIQFSPDVNL